MNRSLKTKYSEQQLVDCSSSYTSRCSGGSAYRAYDYLKYAGGLSTGKAYPYVSGDGYERSCRFNKTTTDLKLKGYIYYNSIEESDLKEVLFTRGPLAVSVDASMQTFHAYKSGIYETSTFGPSTNHAVVLCGFGTEGGVDYWLVKNSWVS